MVRLGLAFIFNLIFSRMSGKAISLGVVNADRGAIGQQFIRQVLGPVGRDGLIVVRSEPTAGRARELAANGTLNAVIVIPAGFPPGWWRTSPPQMQVIANANSPVSAQIARSVAEGYTAGLYRTRLAVGTVLHGPGKPAEPSRAQLRALACRAAAATAPVVFRDVSTATRQLDQKSFFAAGMAVFFLFLTVQFGVTSLLEERSDGTLARLLAAPIGRPQSSAESC